MMPALTPQLERVKRWLTDVGDVITPGQGTNSAGETLSGIQVQHGSVYLLVIDRNGVIAVTATLQVPPSLRSTLGQLSNEVQERLLIAVRSGMMDVPRIGWNIAPATSTRIGDVQTIQLIELMKVGEDEISGFNRLMDAIQELATMTIKIGAILGGAMRPGAMLPSVPTSRPSNHNPAYG